MQTEEFQTGMLEYVKKFRLQRYKCTEPGSANVKPISTLKEYKVSNSPKVEKNSDSGTNRVMENYLKNDYRYS